MSEIQASELSNLVNHPGYRAILRTVLKTQIKQLVEQLSYFAGEEALLLSASVTDGTLSHIGSKSAENFLRTHDQVKSLYLGFCLNKHKKFRPPENTSRNVNQQSKAGQWADSETDSSMDQPSVRCRSHSIGLEDQSPKSQEVNNSPATQENKTEDSTEQINDNGSQNTCKTDSTDPSSESQADKDGASVVTKLAKNVTEKDAKVKRAVTPSIKTFLSKKDYENKEKVGDHKVKQVENGIKKVVAEVENKETENKDGKERILTPVKPKIEPVDPSDNTNNPCTRIQNSPVGTNNSVMKTKNLERVIKGLDMTCDNITDNAGQCNSKTNTAVNKNDEATVFVIKEEPPESDISSDAEDSQGSEVEDDSEAGDMDKDSAVGYYRDGQLSWTTPDLISRYTRKRKPPSVSGPHRKRNVIKMEDKYRAVLDVEAGQRRKDVADRLNIKQSTLCGWLKNADKIKACYLANDYGPERKRIRQSNFPDIEKALLNWSRDAKIHGINISYLLMSEKAEEFARDLGYTEEQFMCTHGWVERFKARYGFTKNATGFIG